MAEAREASTTRPNPLRALGATIGAWPRARPFALAAEIRQFFDKTLLLAGCLNHGHEILAAQMLGADLAYMGTRFIATKECEVHDNIKQELIRRQEFDTVIYGKSIGLQGRGLKSKVIEEVLAIEERHGGFEELIPLLAGQKVKQAWENGDVNYAPLMVGQSIGLISDIPTCAELMERMASEAKEQLARAGKLCGN